MTIMTPTLDIFLASYKRPERLRAMIESVRATGYPARVCVGAGDVTTLNVCAEYRGLVHAAFSDRANARIGCTAPLNLAYRELVRHDALFCTDDCLFEPDALHIAMATLRERFPDGDGVVGLAQANIEGGFDLAFPLFGRAFLDRFAPAGSGRDIFFPGYYHLFNDAEMAVTARALGNWVFEPRAHIRHFHPDSGAPTDATFTRGFTHADHDRALWCARRAAGRLWGVDADDRPIPAAFAGGFYQPTPDNTR